MKIEKNANEENNAIGISSQKKGRFIIQEIEEESNKIFFSPKKYSFDANRIIFAYYTYDNNSNFLSQTDNNNINNYNKNNNNNNLRNNNDLNSSEKQNRLSSLSSKKHCFSSNNKYEYNHDNENDDNNNNYNCSNFPEAPNRYLINKEFNIDRRKTSEENYFSSETNKINNNTTINNNNIKIKTYVLSVEDENYNFLDFELIWKQFILINKINLYNNLDKRIFTYSKQTHEKTHLIPSKKSSSFFSSDQRSQKTENIQNQIKIEKQISQISLKNFSRNNSEKKSLKLNKQSVNNDAKQLLHWSQNLGKIEKRTLSGERMSIFKRNSMNAFCTSFSKKIKNFSNNNNNKINYNDYNNNSEKQKRMSTLKNAFSNKNILQLHSNFKSDLEINYGFEENENENTESNLNLKSSENNKNKQGLPLKKLSEKEITKAFPVTNKTESESFKDKVIHNFLNDGKSKEAECEVNIDIISSGMDSDSRKTENKDEEQKSNKKSYFCQFENTDEFSKNQDYNLINYKDDLYNNEDFDKENDFLFRFHSQGVNNDNNIQSNNNRRVYIEDEFDKADFNLQMNKNKVNFNDHQNFKEEDQESDLLMITEVNFDSDKNIISDVNYPILKIENKTKKNISNIFNINNNKSEINDKYHEQEKFRKENVFEKELNEINERNDKRRFLENECVTNKNDFEDLLKSPLEILFKEEKRENENKKNYKSWNLNLNLNSNKKAIENSNQHLFIKKNFCLQNSCNEKKLNKETLEFSNPTDKIDIFALEDEEDHFYYSCSSVNTPKSKALAVKQHQQTKLSDPLNSRTTHKIISEATSTDNFILKKNKTLKIKFSNLAEKQKHLNQIPQSPKKFTNIIPKYELNNKHIKNNFEINKKLKNANNHKLNLIKSIQKSFVEDEKQKIGILMSRINSADKKFNCVKLKKTEIENTQFEILPCLNKTKEIENEENEEEEEESDSYLNLEVMQVISIEIYGERQK